MSGVKRGPSFGAVCMIHEPEKIGSSSGRKPPSLNTNGAVLLVELRGRTVNQEGGTRVPLLQENSDTVLEIADRVFFIRMGRSFIYYITLENVTTTKVLLLPI